MEYVRLGKTNLLVSRVAFGAMRLSSENTFEGENMSSLVRKAYDSGINFYDTSRKNPESEKLLGDALYDIRKNIFISTSTSSSSVAEILVDIEESLMALHTDFVDLYQYECDKFVPLPGGSDGIYETLFALKSSGKAKHIGLITTNYESAKIASESGAYESLQFPFSVVSNENTVSIVKQCEKSDTGFIAMQPLCGGLLQNIPLAFGFLRQYENVIPLWGVQTMEELEQILYFNSHPPVIDEKFHEDVEHTRMFFN